MSDTPRTDSCYQQILDEGLGLEYAEDELREWSKKLERELTEAQKDADRYRYVRSIWGLPDEKFNAAIDAAMKEGGK
jgi:hypothetical protein